jgi:hypothetical protein
MPSLLATVVLGPELGYRLFGYPVVAAGKTVVADAIGGDVAAQRTLAYTKRCCRLS